MAGQVKPDMWCPGRAPVGAEPWDLGNGLFFLSSFWSGSGDKVMDVSANGLHGDMLGNAAWVPRGVYINGSAGTCVEIPPESTSGSKVTEAITVAMWFNPLTITSSTTDEDTLFYTRQAILRLQGSNDLETYVFNNAGAAFNLDADNIWVADEWQHVALTFDNVNYNIYRNGVLVATSAAFAGDGIGEGAASQFAAIGASKGTVISDISDAIYESVGVWNRALSASEVAAHFANSHALITPPSAF